ncbi:hypothetical protein CLV47_113118 [Antricoccus suffuscus]|uniref:Uncharacterized protein n=1 Tax=Antricoccus suffuscus TaxID=1629062 RepID=A0A2T0ZX68_9ACTN|nr:hypothetical protein [Antricoccus suffuscus]PRZ40952.1 hypothetical protein CLV47_113118 [Antricoccus suffuscus]
MMIPAARGLAIRAAIGARTVERVVIVKAVDTKTAAVVVPAIKAVASVAAIIDQLMARAVTTETATGQIEAAQVVIARTAAVRRDTVQMVVPIADRNVTAAARTVVHSGTVIPLPAADRMTAGLNAAAVVVQITAVPGIDHPVAVTVGIQALHVPTTVLVAAAMSTVLTVVAMTVVRIRDSVVMIRAEAPHAGTTRVEAVFVVTTLVVVRVVTTPGKAVSARAVVGTTPAVVVFVVTTLVVGRAGMTRGVTVSARTVVGTTPAAIVSVAMIRAVAVHVATTPVVVVSVATTLVVAVSARTVGVMIPAQHAAATAANVATAAAIATAAMIVVPLIADTAMIDAHVMRHRVSARRRRRFRTGSIRRCSTVPCSASSTRSARRPTPWRCTWLRPAYL